MPRRIIDNVRAKKASMMTNPAEAGANAVLAVAAINGGIKSPEWRAYMMQFVDQNPPGTAVDPRQLDRLLGNDGTLGHPILNMRRAYLVSNGPCGPTTPERFDFQVNSIDDGLEPACVPAPLTGKPRTGKKAGKKAGKRKYGS